MAVIYKATNTKNGKAYIGFSSNFQSRLTAHKNKAARGDCQYLHNAINKWGWDAFEWQVLYESKDSEHCLRVMEPKLIEEHNTFWENGGYNLTKGGEGTLGSKRSEESKKLISEKAKQRKLTPERLAILRENAQKMRGVPRPKDICERISKSNKGRVFSEDHRQNISLGHASKKDTGSYYQSAEYKEKMSKACKGKVVSEETKEKIRQARLGKKFPRQ